MPELPEVEALRRSLIPFIVGSDIKNVQVLQDKIIAGKGTKRKGTLDNTVKFIESLTGRKIIDIKRRAKNLTILLGNKSILLIHLKMTGQLVFVPSASKVKPFKRQEQARFNLAHSPIIGGHPIQESENKLPHKHTYIIFELNNGTLYYNDIRQFGYCLFFESEQILEDQKHFEGLGVEPLDKEFTLKYFEYKICEYKSKKASPAIKKVLLEQEIVVGCGNIYCDEVLWASSVLPTRGIKSLKKPEIKRIYENIIDILDRAINSGGSSIANYLLADGQRGNYADYHNAYQKTGTKCKFQHPPNSPSKGGQVQNCKGIIQKINLAGRGTHFCPVHQK